MNVLDSSALLCFLLDEPGADVVESLLDDSSRCSAANWSEIARKCLARGLTWSTTRDLLIGCGLEIEPVTAADAEAAALLWVGRQGLSLADRLCIATGARLGATVWTADRAWGASETIRQVRP